MEVNRPGDRAQYAGIPTYSGVDLVLDPAGLPGVDVAVVGAPVDETVTYRAGARFGPRAVRPQPLGLVHFDAHADDAEELHGVVRSHGTPMRLLVEEGSLRGEHVMQIGLRGYWPGPREFAWAREQGFRWYLMEDVHRRGV